MKKIYEGKYLPFKKEDLGSEDEENSKKRKFRLSARNLFLTYSQTFLTKEEVIDQLKSILGDKIKEYFVSQEKHEDSGLHIHVYLKLTSKINIISAKKLDLKDSSGNIIHGQYLSARNSSDVINYVKKAGEFISNSFSSEEFNKTLYELANTSGIEAAMNYFCKQKPEWVCTRYKNIRSNLMSYLSNNKQKVLPKFNREDYVYPEESKKWCETERDSKTLVIIGPSGIGKMEATEAISRRIKKSYANKTFI